MRGQPQSDDKVEDVLLASATVGTYDEQRFPRLMPMSEPPIELPLAEEALPLSELQSLRRQRDELLAHVAELVQQRDAYRARMRKLERSCLKAEEELRCLRDEVVGASPLDDLHRPTERQLLSPHTPTSLAPRRSERPEGGYCLRGSDVPADEEVCCRTRSKAI